MIVAGDPTPETLPRLEKFVEQYDIRIAIHNHGPEDKLWQSPLDILKDIKNTDARIGCCIDVGHTVRAGTDVVEAIHAVGPRLFNMHMKDLADFHNKDSQVAVGEGKLLDSGKRSKLQVKENDRVIFSSYAGTEIKINGEEFLILEEGDVLAVVD